MVASAILFLALSESFGSEKNSGILVLEPAALTATAVREAEASDGGELAQRLAKRGYANVEVGHLHIYVSPSIWQDAKMKADLEQYDHLEAAIRDDGTVDFSKDPELFDTARNLAGRLGYDIQSGDSDSLVLHRTYSFHVGSRDVDLNAAASSDHFNADHLSHPMKRLEGGQGQSTLPKDKLWLDDDLANVCFYAYGILAGDRTAQSKAYRAAVDAIEAHFKEFNDKRKLKSTKLNNRIAGFDVSKYFGKGFSELPKSLQDQLVNDNHNQFGFKKASEFASWLSQGTLTGSQGRATLQLGTDTNGEGLGVGIPK